MKPEGGRVGNEELKIFYPRVHYGHRGGEVIFLLPQWTLRFRKGVFIILQTAQKTQIVLFLINP